MNSTATALQALFNRIPRRHSPENVKDIYSILDEYQDQLISIEAVNLYYEKNIPVYFDEWKTQGPLSKGLQIIKHPKK
ncbi:MAG: hypothetical protein ACKOU7_05515 [Ferruginibacter sp.]